MHEPQDHEILDHLFSEVVVDSIDLKYQINKNPSKEVFCMQTYLILPPMFRNLYRKLL